jgi:large subunit ribosomal protein L11
MFCTQFNERTKGMEPGLVIPAIITIYQDKTFTFILKTPPASVLIKKACGIEKGSAVPHTQKVATLSLDKLEAIAKQKLPDLNANDVAAAMRVIAGTARSMGIETELKK